MGYEIKTGFYRSHNQVNQIAYYVVQPEERPKAILQISHGMCEYFMRYEAFAGYMASRGLVVCGNDHLGHGRSIDSPEDLGFFSHREGYRDLPQDVHTLVRIMKNEYPSIPYFLLGHSMGSFIARAFMVEYGTELDGAILSGTSGGEPLNDVGILLAESISKRKGEKYRSEKLQSLAFGLYNQKISEKRTNFDWISSDKKIVDCYIADPLCNFVFTASGFHDLFQLLKSVSTKEWARRVPKELPVFLVSGDMDPVGNYGSGVKKVYERLMNAGVKDISIHLYHDGRHEMLNEINQNEVYEDIYNWMNARIK